MIMSTMEPWWQFVVDNEAALRATCRMQCRGRWDLVEDLYSECVIGRAQAIYETYDPDHSSGAALATHMFGNMRKYMWKWMNRLGRPYCERLHSQPADDFDAAEELDLRRDDIDEVQVLLSRVTEYEKNLLLLHYVHEYSYAEMGRRFLGCSKGTAKRHTDLAMESLRSHARRTSD